MPKAIITGIAGFAGSHAADYLLANSDWDLIGIDSYRHRGDHSRLEHLRGNPRLTLIKADLSVPLPPRDMRIFAQVDFILNYASDSHVDRSISNPRSVWENNTSLILNVLEAARQAKSLKAFMQVSTDEVYGAAEPGVCYPEWSPIIPSNPYSASKSAQESLAISYWRTYGVPVVICNTMNLIGPRQDPEKFVPKTAQAIMANREVEIHGQPGRIGTRFYTHAANLASALLFLSRRTPAMFKSGATAPDRWNVVGEREMSNLEMAEAVAMELGRPMRYVLRDVGFARPGHDLRYALDGAKLAAAGWEPPIKLDQAIKGAVAWCRDHPDWP